MIAHQGAHQGIPLQGIHQNLKLKMIQRGIVSVYLFLTPFSTIVIAQLAPLSLLSSYVSLCFPI